MHRLEKMEASFALETDLTLIPSIISYLQQVLTSMRFCGERNRLRIGIALEEALLNSYYHGNLEVSSKLREIDHRRFAALAEQRLGENPYRERQIRVAVRLTPEEARFVVRDEGPGFDPGCLPDPTDPENLAKPCGRGVLLMRAFMDEVAYNGRGNEVTMVKKRRSPAGLSCEEEEMP
jgi:anti-sigma regulatory factor (Ser/Thr protein kinase)